MAQRRMFSKIITSSARFLKMPQEAQNLYFHLAMNADDDGVVEAFTIMNMLGSSEDSIRILNAKSLVKVLNEDMVSYIMDWNEHNLIRADRKVNSIYKDLLLQIMPEIEIREPKARADTGVIPRQLTTGRPLDRIGKDRLGKDRIEEEDTTHTRFKKPTLEEVKAYNKERNNCIDASTFIDHYEANGWKVGGRSPMKDWKASIRTWEKTDKKTIARREDDIKYGKKEEEKPQRILTPEEIEAKKIKLQELKSKMGL